LEIAAHLLITIFHFQMLTVIFDYYRVFVTFVRLLVVLDEAPPNPPPTGGKIYVRKNK